MIHLLSTKVTEAMMRIIMSDSAITILHMRLDSHSGEPWFTAVVNSIYETYYRPFPTELMLVISVTIITVDAWMSVP